MCKACANMSLAATAVLMQAKLKDAAANNFAAGATPLAMLSMLPLASLHRLACCLCMSYPASVG